VRTAVPLLQPRRRKRNLELARPPNGRPLDPRCWRRTSTGSIAPPAPVGAGYPGCVVIAGCVVSDLVPVARSVDDRRSVRLGISSRVEIRLRSSARSATRARDYMQSGRAAGWLAPAGSLGPDASVGRGSVWAGESRSRASRDGARTRYVSAARSWVEPPHDVAASPPYLREMNTKEWVRLAPWHSRRWPRRRCSSSSGRSWWLSEPIWVRRSARSGRRDPSRRSSRLRCPLRSQTGSTPSVSHGLPPSAARLGRRLRGGRERAHACSVPSGPRIGRDRRGLSALGRDSRGHLISAAPNDRPRARR
jgi:hypothetical protein